MTKYFVISTDPLEPAQVEELKNSLVGGAWWHWLPNFWLVRNNNGNLTAAHIRNEIRKINDTARAVVLEVTPVTWAALTKPNASGREMSDWIKENWGT